MIWKMNKKSIIFYSFALLNDGQGLDILMPSEWKRNQLTWVLEPFFREQLLKATNKKRER
jgi:hypothetical protein